MDDLPQVRYAIVSAVQLLTLNSQLLARQLHQPNVVRSGRTALVERMARIKLAMEALVRTIEGIVDHPADQQTARTVRALMEQVVQLVGYIEFLDRQVQARELRPLRLAEYADGLHAEAVRLLPLLDAVLTGRSVTND